MKRIVVMGAGAVGRGLLGKIFANSGHRVCFVEKDTMLAMQLANNFYYPLNVDGTIEWVGPITAVPLSSEGKVIEEIREANLVLVSVRRENLEGVTKLLKRALGLCPQLLETKKIILVENMPNAADEAIKVLRVDVSAVMHLKPNCYQGIANCVIPEVPDEIKKLDPTFMYGDSRGYLVLPKSAQEEWMDDATIEFVDDGRFALEWDMKWYLHCAFHLVVGLLGCKNKEEFVYQVFENKDLRSKLVFLESSIAASLCLKSGDGAEQNTITDRAQDEIMWMSQRNAIPDTCKRLIRDLARKVEPGERLDDLIGLLGQHAVVNEATDYAEEALR